MDALDHPELLRRHRLPAHPFHRMGEAGVIGPEVRVESLEGEAVERAPIGPRHAATVDRPNRRFAATAGEDAVVAVQHPLRLDGRYSPITVSATPGVVDLAPLLAA